MHQDRYGNPLSTHSRAAVDKYNAALELIRLYRGDPIAALDAAIEDDPHFAMAWAARAGLLVQQTNRTYLDEVDRSLKAGIASGGNDREARTSGGSAGLVVWPDEREHREICAHRPGQSDRPVRTADRTCGLLLHRPAARASRLAAAGDARLQAHRRRLSCPARHGRVRARGVR
jgi:hypothetical protein